MGLLQKVSLRSKHSTGGRRLVGGHTHRGTPPEEVPIGRGTRITCHDGDLGRLDHVLLDPQTDRIRVLVVRRGHLPGRDAIVAMGRVESSAEDEVRIDAGKRPSTWQCSGWL